LKVYAAAYFIAMSEYTGDPEGMESMGLLEICKEEISLGTQLDFGNQFETRGSSTMRCRL